MAFMFHRELAIPLWGVAVCVVAVSTLPRVLPSVIAVVGIAAAGYTMRALARRLAPSHPSTRRGASHARDEKAGDTADHVRMDDDGGG